MTTLTVLDNGFIQLPQNILQLFGLKKGDTLEINTSPKHLIIEPKTDKLEIDKLKTQDKEFVLDDETKALIERSFGMFKVKNENMPKEKFHEINVADYTTLFDEAD